MNAVNFDNLSPIDKLQYVDLAVVDSLQDARRIIT
jgi:hypothetical protein